MRRLLTTFILVALAVGVSLLLAQLPCAAWTEEEEMRISEHLPWGIPVSVSSAVQTTLSIMTAYIVSYSFETRCPEWAAYHVTPDYLEVPNREGKYKELHDHLGAKYDDFTNSGYDRGHLAPYKIAGGVREGVGLDCSSGYCDQVIFEVNYMTNIAPQHRRFNQGGGLWYDLEEDVRDWLDNETTDLWVIAGCIYLDGVHEAIGPGCDIWVPDAFFKIVAKDVGADEPVVLAFLFPHQEARLGKVEDFLVPVDLIEALTDYNFFPDFTEAESGWEAVSTALNWNNF